MAESADYDPGPWAGHNFASARSAYDASAGRSYAQAVSAGRTASDLVPVEISTDSAHPLLIRCDVTGSMSGWPGTIFSKLPYLDHEVRTEYLGEDAQISFGAISDTGDNYPLQIQPFTIGTDMKDSLQKLVVTNGGSGPGMYCEAYGVAALYDLRNVHMPNAVIRPILIIIGDEMPYHLVGTNDAKQAKVTLEKGLSADQIFAELTEAYSVYLVQKPYGSESLTKDRLSGVTSQVHEKWESILGPGRIALLGAPDRVVDVIFGILAEEAGRRDYFQKEIEARQRANQVEEVYESLESIHLLGPGAAASGRSVTRGRSGTGQNSRSLLD